MPNQKKIIFFGTSFFAKEIFLFLLKKNYPILAVVTQTETKKNFRHHPSEVKLAWQETEKTIPLFEPEECADESFLTKLKELQADIFLVVAYGKILPKILLKIPKIDSINIHASLLPKYRGAAPIQRAIMAGETETGITIMKVIEACDAGEIIRKEKISISEDEIFTEIEKRLINLAKCEVQKALEDFETGHVAYAPQDPHLVTYARKIQKEECQIDWKNEAKIIHNQVRALSYKPGAWSWVDLGKEKKRIKIYRSKITSLKDQIGKTISYDKKLVVACRDFSLELLEVQLEGKNRMTGKEFLQGMHHLPIFLS